MFSSLKTNCIFENCFGQALEHVLNAHPAVADSWVTGYHVAGLGSLPRAYVVLKHGHSATTDQVSSLHLMT